MNAPGPVNSWRDPISEREASVFFDGVDCFILSATGHKPERFYIPNVPEWGANKCFLLAAGEACRWGYFRAFGHHFEDREKFKNQGGQ